MAKPQVFFTNLHTNSDNTLLDKAEKLAVVAGLESVCAGGRLVAVKVHFGEPGNVSYVRHNYVARIVRAIKAFGGKPFVTDANTLYKGRRANAIDHIISATENGFNEAVLGCPVIIADGLRGHDHREIEIGQKHFKAALIASAIAEADSIVSISHFKGHVETGYGGTVKNLGMGCGSRDGKHRMHSNSTPHIERDNCVGCGECVSHCAYNAISLDSARKAVIDGSRCVGCGQCISVCEYEAAQITWENGGAELGERIAEYALASLKGKPHLHMNFITEVSPHCDCMDHNDIPIIPDVGMLASLDPVAIDAASVQLANEAPINPSSIMSRHVRSGDGKGTDKFSLLYRESGWKESLDYCEKIGLGSTSFELIKTGYN